MNLIKQTINLFDYIKRLYRKYFKFKRNSCYPPGHYYSPIVSVEDVKKQEFKIWDIGNNECIMGIDLQADAQIKLLENFTKYYDEIPFKPGKQAKIRFHYENDYYSYTDSIILHSMIRHFKPKKIIEIGSGFSSAVMLDTNELFFDNQIDLIFIEPYLNRLYSIMTEEDKISATIIQNDVQLITLDNFEKLQAGDFLFVDSSHVVKTGSDVNYILFEILPLLRSGVLIHFHDIFYPFEYPKEWVFMGRNWNETYSLKAFMMYNNKFEIRLFSDFIHKHFKDAFRNMPLSYKNTGGNLWLEKK